MLHVVFEYMIISVLDSTEKQVKICAIAKVAVLIVVCFIQIYMISSFFKNKSFGPIV
jgi:hypothetical protein